MSIVRRAARRRTALCLAIAAVAACGSTDPLRTSPVGRYALVGCTVPNFGVTTPGLPCSWGTGGGSTAWDPSSYLELNADGSAVRFTQSTFTFSATVPPPGGGTTVSTSTQVGRWTMMPGAVAITWDGSTQPTHIERITADTLLDNSVFADFFYFWYAKSP